MESSKILANGLNTPNLTYKQYLDYMLGINADAENNTKIHLDTLL